MSLDFSVTKHEPQDGQKILAMNGGAAGYITTQEFMEYVLASRGKANGIATLGPDGKVPEAQIPDMAKDVLAFSSMSYFPSTGADGVLYIAKDTNTPYRWDGSQYTSVNTDTSELEERVGALETDVEQKAGKSYVDDQLALKANAETTYTKTEVDALVEQAKPADYDEVKERVSELEAEVSTLKEKNTRQDAEIKTLQLMAEGTIGTKDKQSLDGYTVDVKARGVSGTVVGYGLLDEMEGRDEAYSEVDLASTALGAWHSMQYNGATVWYASNPNQKPSATVYSHTKYTPVGNLELCARTNNSITCHGGSGGSIWLRDDSITDGSQIGGILRYDGKVNTIHNNSVTEIVSEGANLIMWRTGSLDVSTGEEVANSKRARSDFVKVIGGETVTLFCDGNYQHRTLVLYDDDKNFIRVDYSWLVPYGETPSRQYLTGTVPLDAKYIRFVTSMYPESDITDINAVKVALYRGSYTSGLTYKPYKGTISTLTLPSICAGLHGLPKARDKVSFVNQVYDNMKAVDLGALDWAWDTGWGSFRVRNLPDFSPTNAATQVPSLLCSRYATVAYGIDFPDKTIAAWNSLGNNIIIRDDAFGTDASAFKASLSGVILHYEATSGGQRYEAKVLTRRFDQQVYTVDGSADEEWGLNTTYGYRFYLRPTPWNHVVRGFGSNASVCVASSNWLTVDSANMTQDYAGVSKVVGFWSDGAPVIRLEEYGHETITTVDQFRAYLAQHPLQFVIGCGDQILDVTDQLPAEQPLIEVEDGGTLTFANENKVATPSTMTFPVQLGGTT